ncbi:MAG: ABC transporter permease [Ornithinimicrobium sp.]
MTTKAAEIDMEGDVEAQNRPKDKTPMVQWVAQPLLCVVAVLGCLIYVRSADLNESEAIQLAAAPLLTLLREHMTVALSATVIVVLLAVPLGVALTRGPLRRFAVPIMTIAGFGQAAPAIGLIGISAALFGLGVRASIIALVVYGVLPIVANTVAGLQGVDPRLVEASRGMGMSSMATLLRIELPLALPVIVAGIRIALVLIVGTTSLVVFIGGGGLGSPINTGITLAQPTVLIVGAILVAALALFVDWLARLVELVAAPKGLR